MKYCVNFFVVMVLSLLALSASAQKKVSSNGLTMEGWHLDGPPKVENLSKETGSVVFAVEIDSLGEVLSVRVIQKNISTELAQKCEAAIRLLSFVRDADNKSTAPTSKGEITFVFKVH